jgi:hypothetical protein
MPSWHHSKCADHVLTLLKEIIVAPGQYRIVKRVYSSAALPATMRFLVVSQSQISASK